MEPLIDVVLDVVNVPDLFTPDPMLGRWRYWRRDVGPTTWLRVVVAWMEGPPHVVTAFPDRKDPL